MDYNIYQRVKPTEIHYNIDIGLPYGEMPNEALVKKFEETAGLRDSEDLYDDYARGTLRDNSPDMASLESDQPRKNYNSMGYLNLLHYGGRGEENAPAHPEMFLELTEREPRGIATDPDFRRLADQQESRMRFKRFSPDTDNSVHEGRWSELESYYKARIAVQKAVQPRAMIFSTAFDGRREGLRREDYPHVSYVNKVEEDITRFRPESQAFVDYITDYALNPQRHVTKISNEIIRNSRMYNMFTTDHEFKVAKYGDNPRKQKLASFKSHVKDSDLEDFNMVADATEDPSVIFKSAGLLMGAIVAQKHKSGGDQTGGTAETGSGLQGESGRKTAALKQNLNEVLREAKQEQKFGKQTATKQGKNAAPTIAGHLAETTDVQHLTPANHLFNAEIMYKSVQPNAASDMLRHEILTDDRKPVRVEELTIFGKSGSRKIKTGAKDTIMEVEGKQMQTATYKQGSRAVANPKVGNFNGEDFAQSSDMSQTRQLNHKQIRNTGKDEISTDPTQFYNNLSKERRIAPMGKDKYALRRHTNTDTEINELNG